MWVCSIIPKAQALVSWEGGYSQILPDFENDPLPHYRRRQACSNRSRTIAEWVRAGEWELVRLLPEWRVVVDHIGLYVDADIEVVLFVLPLTVYRPPLGANRKSGTRKRKKYAAYLRRWTSGGAKRRLLRLIQFQVGLVEDREE